MRGPATVFVVAFLIASFADAEQMKLTETAAVGLAIRQNLSIASARVQLEAKRLVSETAWGQLVPGMSLNAGVSRSNQTISVQSPGVPYHWSGSAGLGLSVSMSAATAQGVETARLDYQAGRISLQQATDAITLQIRKDFYALILLQNQLTVTRASIATAEQTLEQVRTDYANGRVQRLTVRQAELSLQSARLVLQRQTVQYENTLASFKNVLAIPQETDVELEGSIEIEPVTTSAPELTTEIDGRDDIRNITAQIALQQSKNREARLALLSPVLTLSATVAPTFPDPLNFDNPPGVGWNDRGSLSLSLSATSLLAFLPFTPQNVGLQNAGKALQSLELQRQQLVASAKTEVHSLVRSLAASNAAIDSLKASVSLAQESYDLTKEAYGLGTADFLTLKSAEDDLLKARYDVLSEQFNYLATLLNLEHATGSNLRSRKE